MEPNLQRADPNSRWLMMLMFLLSGLLVVSVGLTFAPLIPSNYRVLCQAAVIVFFLAVAQSCYRNTRLRPHWRLPLAYSVACCALVASGYTGDWTLSLSGKAFETPEGLAALKIGEDATIVGIIIILALLTGDKPAELYLSKGRLQLGLSIGITSFLVLMIIGIALTLGQGVPHARVRELLPVFVMVALADGFMEELLFRGLFLKRIGRLIGDNRGNAVTAAVFAFAHVQVQFVANVSAFLVVVFVLGMLWGWIMQRTESWLAPSLVHAGVDMLIMADFFRSYSGTI